MKFSKFTLMTLAVLLFGSTLVAQQSTVSQATSGTSRQPVDSTPTKDQIFAKCLVIANQEQVTISRFAQENATNEEVKQFAATLEKAHQICLDKLEGIVSPTESDNNKAVATTTSSPSNNPAIVDFMQLNQEISTQCLKDSQEYLTKKKGTEFDACFVGMQIAKHAGMHSALTVLQRHATGKLQSLIKADIETNTQHMEAAVKLMERIAAKDSAKLSKISK